MQLADELAADGSHLHLVAVHPPVLALWRRAGVLDAIAPGGVHETVDDALAALARERQGDLLPGGRSLA